MTPPTISELTLDARARLEVDRQPEHVEDHLLGGGPRLVQCRLLHRTGVQDVCPKARYAIRRLPLLDLLTAAIARRVGR